MRRASRRLRRRQRPDPLRVAVRRTVHGGPGRRRAEPLATRLERMERDVQETRTRINALFFAVIGVGLGDVVGRLVVGS